MNGERPYSVVKLGGSLLRRADWPALLSTWLARRPSERCHVMIVGGGEAADAVREADRLHHLGDETSHWLAIEAMQENLEAAAAQFPQSPTCRCLHQLAPLRKTASLVWLDVMPLLRQEHTWRGLPPLPHSWDVTSDSIAARVACRLGNTELVLLKSALPPQPGSLADWAQAGYVDAFFPHAASVLAGLMVNLTAPDHPELTWRGSEAGLPTTHQ